MTRDRDIEGFTPSTECIVGIDSDGCAFDTMELKWKECFIPRAIEHFGLQAVASCARRCLEFVNLYSRSRGVNRFFGLLESLDWLERMPAVAARGFRVPVLTGLRDWVSGNPQPSGPQLAAAAAGGDPDLAVALAWTEAVDADIARLVHGVPPFPSMPAALARLAGRADVVVVSSTPVAALEREWREHGLDRHVDLICGQETGSKRAVLARLAGLRPPERVLMIGDAPGDLQAARANGVPFFPVVPHREAASWRRFADEALDRFLSGTYTGAYVEAVTAEFEARLPAEPDFLADPS